MPVSIQEICTFASVTPRSKNFTGGEYIINQGHLLNCGKVNENNSDSLQIIAFCLQSSNIRDDPHKINGEVLKDGKIIAMSCSCEAGLSSACKHTVATLLYLNRNNLEDLKVISSADKKCAWNVPKKSALEKYDMKPLMLHSCFLEQKNSLIKKKIEHKEPRKSNLLKDSTSRDADVTLQVKKDDNDAELSQPNSPDVNDHVEPLQRSNPDVMQQNIDDEFFRQIMIAHNPLSALAMHM